jgi:hypothetical protein
LCTYKEEPVAMDLGSVSTGYSDRPVARAIKIKHAGLNLTGPERMGLSMVNATEKTWTV